MLKMVNHKLILLGLDAENVKRLQKCQPILVKGTAIGLRQDIVIAYGETLEALAAELGVPTGHMKTDGTVPSFGWDIEGDVLVIRDHFSSKSPTPTVTNAIERVMAQIKERLDVNMKPMPKLAIYQDSDGNWEGIIHDNGAFKSFAYLGVRTKAEAIKAIKVLPLGDFELSI